MNDQKGASVQPADSICYPDNTNINADGKRPTTARDQHTTPWMNDQGIASVQQAVSIGNPDSTNINDNGLLIGPSTNIGPSSAGPEVSRLRSSENTILKLNEQEGDPGQTADVSKLVLDRPEEEIWLLPGRTEFNLRHGNQDQYTVLEMSNQDRAPTNINKVEDGHRRDSGELVPAKHAVESSFEMSVKSDDPLLRVEDIDIDINIDFWLWASVESDASLVGIENINPDLVKESGANADLKVGLSPPKNECQDTAQKP